MSVYNKLFCFSSLLIDKIEGWSKLTNSFTGRGVAVFRLTLIASTGCLFTVYCYQLSSLPLHTAFTVPISY
ncbi:unnamed protein product [Schistosoma haematobium]|nr:unnamed protein product [Schistosoma haematobium]